MDRTNDQVAAWYSPHHPAVLRTLVQIVTAATQANKPISLCGNIATDPKMIPFLIGIGLRTFSLEPTAIPIVQELISRIDIAQSQRLAQQMLTLSRQEEVTKFLTTCTK